MKIRVQVALLRFTPPEGMPWVRSESPTAVKDTVVSLIPEADIWVSADENSAPPEDLKKALNWAAKGQTSVHSGAEEGLIIVAGSLYLVADFYRLLQTQERVVEL
jgi:dihydrofolate synthase